MVSVELKGVDELLKKFSNAADAMQGRAIKNALFKAARPIRDEARRQAPVADKTIIRKTKHSDVVYRIGNLKKSITIFKGKNKKWINVHVGAAYGANKKYDGYYAHFVHEGHKIKNGGQTEANPFLKRAEESKRNEAITIFTTEFNKELEKAFA